MFSFFENKKEKESSSSNEKSSLDIVKELVLRINEDIDTDKIKPEELLENLGLDSIKFMDILLSLEDILGMELEYFIEEIELSEIVRVEDLVNTIDKLKS
ncbi:phosphopantetheine-binding protein [Snuella sedimenti]|uniref:Carrier domain-containing protein n=1 Tax=Snuella sedimenti TaxID=2798802 RepID=A0A8J7IRD8_9FLAO|nr:phosphopantetheine-binding protein [Snuella sedimenti]MBJ6369747.1 hypothetical protein [Snuella sedimenti]